MSAAPVEPDPTVGLALGVVVAVVGAVVVEGAEDHPVGEVGAASLLTLLVVGELRGDDVEHPASSSGINPASGC